MYVSDICHLSISKVEFRVIVNAGSNAPPSPQKALSIVIPPAPTSSHYNIQDLESGDFGLFGSGTQAGKHDWCIQAKLVYFC